MNLDLSVILSPGELNAYAEQCEAQLIALNADEALAIQQIAAGFEAQRSQVQRSVLAGLIGGASVASPPPINILTGDKMLCAPGFDCLASPVSASPLPPVSEPMPMPTEPDRTHEEMGFDGTAPNPQAETEAEPDLDILCWEEAGEELGVSRDTVRLYASKGFLKAQGPKGHVSRSSVMAYAKTRTAPGQRKAVPPKSPSSSPASAFDINEGGRFEAIEHGQSFYRPDKAFDLWRICGPSGYQWRVAHGGKVSDVGLEGGEIVEHWKLNGLGRWESAPHFPGTVGIGNGTTKGAGGYTVPVLG